MREPLLIVAFLSWSGVSYIAVGPEGRISYCFEDGQKGFEEEGATSKSACTVLGSTILRIYNDRCGCEQLYA
jgi:hypothetical protein